MLTYAHVCSRMLTYAHVCSRMLSYAASSLLSLLLPAVCDAAAPVRDTDSPAANSLRPLPLAVRRELDTAISGVVAISGSALSADDSETYDAQNAWDKRKSVAELASRCRMLAYAYVCSRMLTYSHVCCRMLSYADVRSRMHKWVAELASDITDICSRIHTLTSVDVR
jgi:hypothetical protein